MVLFAVDDDAPLSVDELAKRLKDNYQILIGGPRGGQIRAVTHYWIKRPHVDQIIHAMRTLLS
jgi:hypothetical protein